jgi:hypothetical protein
MQDTTSLIQEVHALYDEEKLFVAREKLLELDSQSTINEDPILRKVVQEAELAQRILDAISDDTWDLSTNSNNTQVYYREEGNALHSLKIVGTIDSPMFNVLAIFYECDLYQTWTPRMKSNTILQHSKKYRYLIQSVFDMPWPLYDREVLAYGYGVDLGDKILVVVRSVKPEEHEQFDITLPDEDPSKHARMDINYAGILIAPISPTQTSVTLISNVDPKLDFVPSWFINTVTHNMSHFVIDTLRSVASTIDTNETYMQRIKEKDEIYGDLKRRAEAFFETTEQVSDEEEQVDVD